jgi:phosphohistidine swiveling domain-containing protein
MDEKYDLKQVMAHMENNEDEKFEDQMILYAANMENEKLSEMQEAINSLKGKGGSIIVGGPSLDNVVEWLKREDVAEAIKNGNFIVIDSIPEVPVPELEKFDPMIFEEEFIEHGVPKLKSTYLKNNSKGVMQKWQNKPKIKDKLLKNRRKR